MAGESPIADVAHVIQVAALFILAMLFLVAALLLFLREVFIAATRVRIGPGAEGGLASLHPAHHGPAEADVRAPVGPRRGREAPGRPGEEP